MSQDTFDRLAAQFFVGLDHDCYENPTAALADLLRVAVKDAMVQWPCAACIMKHDDTIRAHINGPGCALSVVSAPGDRCGGSGVLPDDMKCPGCRACA